MATTTPPEETGIPSFDALAPLLDRLVELAAQELPDPHQVTVQGWADGDFDARADHSHGLKNGLKHYERVEYDPDKAAFVYGWVVYDPDAERTVRRDERVLEAYDNPV